MSNGLTFTRWIQIRLLMNDNVAVMAGCVNGLIVKRDHISIQVHSLFLQIYTLKQTIKMSSAIRSQLKSNCGSLLSPTVVDCNRAAISKSAQLFFTRKFDHHDGLETTPEPPNTSSTSYVEKM